jgi:hypothetical protein
MSENAAGQPQFHYGSTVAAVPAVGLNTNSPGVSGTVSGVNNTIVIANKEKEAVNVKTPNENNLDDFPKFDDMHFAQIALILFR